MTAMNLGPLSPWPGRWTDALLCAYCEHPITKATIDSRGRCRNCGGGERIVEATSPNGTRFAAGGVLPPAKEPLFERDGLEAIVPLPGGILPAFRKKPILVEFSEDFYEAIPVIPNTIIER